MKNLEFTLYIISLLVLVFFVIMVGVRAIVKRSPKRKQVIKICIVALLFLILLLALPWIAIAFISLP